MKFLYLSLWDSAGCEAHFPGYFRPACTFKYSSGTFSNDHSISWAVSGESHQHLTTVKVHEHQWGAELFSFPLSSPVSHVNVGDTISFSHGCLRISMDVGLSRVLSRSVAADVAIFDKYLADHPDATMQEIWDAAFVAGHQTAHTLLTGEPHE